MPTAQSNTFSRLISGIAFALTVLLFLLLAAPGVASAHAQLKSSNPADGATVGKGMAQIVLVFSEDISPSQSSAQLVGSGGPVTSGVTAAVDRAVRTRMTIATPALEAGRYILKWTAVTDNDNAHTFGQISFTVSGTSSLGSGATTDSGSTTGSGNELLFAAILAAAVAVSALVLALRRRANA
jgi:methionine-rich copper-binding protein CopC